MKFTDLLTIAKTELSDLSTLDQPDFRLEQAEYDDQNDIWNIVVSFLVPNTNRKRTTLSALTSEFEFVRLYKKVKINGNKEVIGMYMHKE